MFLPKTLCYIFAFIYHLRVAAIMQASAHSSILTLFVTTIINIITHYYYNQY